MRVHRRVEHLHRRDPVPGITRGRGFAGGIDADQLIGRNRPGAGQPLGGLDLRLPADVAAQVGLREGDRQDIGGQRLADRLHHAPHQRRGVGWRGQGGGGIVGAGVEEPGQHVSILRRDHPQRLGAVEGQHRRAPVAVPGEAEDARRQGGRDLGGLGHRLAGGGFLPQQQFDIEPAPKKGGLTCARNLQQCLRLIERAEIQQPVDPRDQEAAACPGIGGWIDLGQDQRIEQILQRGQQPHRLGLQQRDQVGAGAALPEVARQPADRDRDQPGRVKLLGAQHGNVDAGRRRLPDRRHGGHHIGRRRHDRRGDRARQPVDRRHRRIGQAGARPEDGPDQRQRSQGPPNRHSA